MHEHGKAWSVYKINLYVVPLSECQGILHGCPPGYILFVVGGYGAAVIDATESLGHFGGLQKGGDQGCFAAVGMTHQGHVANVLSLIDFQ